MNSKLFPYQFIDANVEALNAKHHTSSLVLYMTVVFFLLAAVFSLPFINVDISTQAAGIIRAKQNDNLITAGVYGQVESIFIQENQAIKAGDTLLMLNTSKLEEQLRFNKEKIQEHSFFIQDLTTLLEQRTSINLHTSLYTYEYLQYTEKVAEQDLKIKHKRMKLDRSKQLLVTGAVAKNDHEQILFDYQLAESTLKLLKDQQLKLWELELQKYKRANRELTSKNKQLIKEKKEHIVLAPISGFITKHTGMQAGNFIAPSQTIAYIASTTNLIVENYVSPTDIGLLKEGMPIKIQVDAFNYNQWGLANGIVESISTDIAEVKGQPFFIVQSILECTFLELSNGYRGSLKKGMTLSSRFQITPYTFS